MALLRVGAQPQTAAEQQRASLLKKQFAAHNRKLEQMVKDKMAPSYIVGVAEKYNMAAEDLTETVFNYVRVELEKDQAPSSQAKESKKSSKKSEKSESKAESSEPAAE